MSRGNVRQQGGGADRDRERISLLCSLKRAIHEKVGRACVSEGAAQVRCVCVRVHAHFLPLLEE